MVVGLWGQTRGDSGGVHTWGQNRGSLPAHRGLVLSLAGTGIELTLQIQNDVGAKATLKEFREKLAGDEKHQRAVGALREEVESFASLFPLPGLPDF